MAYVISDACISCGACEGTCPAGAISEGDGQYVIDADSCMEWSLRRRMSSRSYQPGIISRYVYCSNNKKEMHFYASLFCSIYSLTCFDVGKDSIAPSVAMDRAAV
mgnify:CR=1 FL=1